MRAACLAALTISPQACLAFAGEHGWEASARAFVDNIGHARWPDPQAEPVQFAVKHPRLIA